MKHFKKRTIALVLASVITVAGSFAAENYKNSLMSLKFINAENGTVNMSVETKTPYTGNVSPVRRDANTYILTLSEMDNFINDSINLENARGNIASVDVKTLPYTNNAKGYTRVTIKTHAPVNIIGQNKIFIPSESREPARLPEGIQQNVNNKPRSEERKTPSEQPRQNNKQLEEFYRPKSEQISPAAPPPAPYKKTDSNESKPANLEKNIPESKNIQNYEADEKDPFAALMLVLGILLFLAITTAFGLRAKNKLQEITGERFDIDLTDDEEKPKDNKRKQIKKAIKKLDSTYSKTAVMPSRQEYTVSEPSVKTVKPAEELNVVDLDELFKEQQGKTKEEESGSQADENDALEDFLSGFSFDDDIKEDVSEEEASSYDEEYYETVINKQDLSFTKNDIECMNQLLNTEINDEVLRNKNEYAQASPAPKQVKTLEQVIEELVTTYKISQNISFNTEDINTLKKLISVEIDNDFITDLRTNPERTKQMQEEINASRNKPRKPSEILTLNVKDMLPDLSEALKRQGNRRIESEVKPITVYASEGYEVSKLTLNESLPDLSKEINNKNAYIAKPSAEYDIVDTSYKVETLSLKDSLPDLSDVLKNPKKYERPEPEPVEVDEESLLKNILNVQFKPFDDGSREFEILNEIDAPSIEDIQNEFNQFENFQTYNDDEEYTTQTETNHYDDFESLYSNDYFDLDKPQAEKAEEKADSAEAELEPETELEEVAEETPKEELPVEKEVQEAEVVQEKIQEEVILPKLERAVDENAAASKRIRTKLSDDIMKKIEETKSAREERKERILQQKKTKSLIKQKENPKPQTEIKCILDGITYNVVSTTEFSANKGCHLAKTNNGYVVLGYIDNTFQKITEFETLKSEHIISRLSEKQSDGSSRYIIRIGINKFMVNVTDNNIEYLMTL